MGTFLGLTQACFTELGKYPELDYYHLINIKADNAKIIRANYKLKVIDLFQDESLNNCTQMKTDGEQKLIERMEKAVVPDEKKGEQNKKKYSPEKDKTWL